ncbi:hypothetical protein CBS11852_6455 [Aspergillus niger]|nr:hypothetical protein CBS11852_6455 [Aspergillus niger]
MNEPQVLSPTPNTPPSSLAWDTMANQYTFNTPLHKTGNEDSAYRITNLPNQEQRPYLLQNTIYRSDHVVKSQLQHVIHVKLNPGDHVSNNATTIVAKFEFLGQTVDRRFKYARIKWETVYADGDDNDEDTDAPEVRKVSLDGQYVIHESVLSVSKEVHGDAGVQGCCGVAMASAGTGWSRSQTAEVKDHISIFGVSVFTNQLCGEPNGAQ